jgi:hypothetical protein
MPAKHQRYQGVKAMLCRGSESTLYRKQPDKQLVRREGQHIAGGPPPLSSDKGRRNVPWPPQYIFPRPAPVPLAPAPLAPLALPPTCRQRDGQCPGAAGAGHTDPQGQRSTHGGQELDHGICSGTHPTPAEFQLQQGTPGYACWTHWRWLQTWPSLVELILCLLPPTCVGSLVWCCCSRCLLLFQ